MAIHTLGTKSTVSLRCTPPWGGTTANPITTSDVAAVDQSITSDVVFGSILAGQSFGITATVTTGTTQGTTALTAVTALSTTGQPAVTQIQTGDLVLGIGIPLGTFVTATAASGAQITISNAATTSSASTPLAFVRESNPVGVAGGGLFPQTIMSMGTLYIPGRGELRVFPGDVVAIDNTGWPILVSANSISYGGSQWTFT